MNIMFKQKGNSPMSRMLMMILLLLTSAIQTMGAVEVAPPLPVEPIPTAEQLAWQRLETIMFLHFGMQSQTNRQFVFINKVKTETEQAFNPLHFDATQWAKTAKAAGFRLLILTAKHHDGFCLWPTKYTEHCVRNCPWKAGKGDVIKDFVDACRAEGVQPGLYLSPWDWNHPDYGDSPKYNAYYANQITELLSNYGPITEIWFDGAGGGNRKGLKQQYDWPTFHSLIRKLQPKTLKAVKGPDIRWVGNESGIAGDNESSIAPASPTMHPGKTTVWYPSECDVSIRPSWFWHPEEDTRVKSVARLMRLYFASVGRNSVMLLNVPPNDQGLMADVDVQRLKDFKAALDQLYSVNLAARCPVKASSVRGNSDRFSPGKTLDADLDSYWATDDGVTTGELEFDLGQPRTFDVIRVQEAIALGERVQEWHVEAMVDGKWKKLCKGTTIGQKRLWRTAPVTATKVKLVIDKSKACPTIAEFGLHVMTAIKPPSTETETSGSLAAFKPVHASSVQADYEQFNPENAVDDDQSSRWAPAQGGESWLEVDLLNPTTFGRVVVTTWEPKIKKFEVQYRDNENSPWKVCHRGEVGAGYTSNFPSVTAQYVRLNFPNPKASPGIREFQLFPPEK